ncbi:MAG TPA: hypothetical protein VKZ65_02360, partial [Glycomyces sp.]|nr:hypothetical protein [Glycomyces sp.]
MSLAVDPFTGRMVCHRCDAFLQARGEACGETGGMNENKVNPIPEGYHSITPFIVVREAAKA